MARSPPGVLVAGATVLVLVLLTYWRLAVDHGVPPVPAADSRAHAPAHGGDAGGPAARVRLDLHVMSQCPGAPTPAPAPVDRLDRLWVEWNAFEFGDLDAIGVIVAGAKANDPRAVKALAQLERVNPTALQSFINRKAAA